MTRASSVPVWFGAHVLHTTENQDVVEGDDPCNTWRTKQVPKDNLIVLLFSHALLFMTKTYVFSSIRRKPPRGMYKILNVDMYTV